MRPAAPTRPRNDGRQVCENVLIIELACACLASRYVPATSGTGMQLLPSVLNDKFDDSHADCSHADASALVRETAERIFGKRGASDFYKLFSSTQAGSASRMTTNPRVKRRPCRPGCRFIPTCYSAKISMKLVLSSQAIFSSTTAFEHLVCNFVSKLDVSGDAHHFKPR